MPEQIGVDVFAEEVRGKGISAIEDTPDRDVPALKIAMCHMLEVSVRVGIVQCTVLAERFPIVAPLYAVQHAVAAVVRAIEQVAVLVEIQSPGVAAPFAEQLETPRDRMIPPHTLLELDAANIGRHRAPLAAVEPAVGTPGQRVGHRMGVFHAEA